MTARQQLPSQATHSIGDSLTHTLLHFGRPPAVEMVPVLAIIPYTQGLSLNPYHILYVIHHVLHIYLLYTIYQTCYIFIFRADGAVALGLKTSAIIHWGQCSCGAGKAGAALSCPLSVVKQPLAKPAKVLSCLCIPNRCWMLSCSRMGEASHLSCLHACVDAAQVFSLNLCMIALLHDCAVCRHVGGCVIAWLPLTITTGPTQCSKSHVTKLTGPMEMDNILLGRCIPSIFCHFLTRVDSLLWLGLASEAGVPLPGVRVSEMTKPYRSVTMGLRDVIIASEVASAAWGTVKSQGLSQ